MMRLSTIYCAQLVLHVLCQPLAAELTIERTVQPGTPVHPAMGVTYNPDQGERLVVNANHVIPADMVVQGDSVVLRLREADVAGMDPAQLQTNWTLTEAVGTATLTPSATDPLEATLLADHYGTNIVDVTVTDGTSVETGRAEILVEFSTGFMLEDSMTADDSVEVPTYPGSENFVDPDEGFPETFCCHREQVTDRNPQTGRLVTQWQVKYGSGDAAPMGQAVMVSDDHGITWTKHEYLYRKPDSNTGWGAVGWSPRGNGGLGEMLMWSCSHVRAADNRMMLFRSRDNAESWQHVGDFQAQINAALGIADGNATYFGVNRIIATRKGTLVAPMVSQQWVRVIYSTDNGQTWQNSNIDNTFAHGNENAIVETVDGGKLILIARWSTNTARRFVSIDGGITWTDESNAAIPAIGANLGLGRLDDPGEPYHGRIIHCCATASNAGFTGRGRMVVSINSDVSGVAKTAWDSRLLFDFTAVYSDVFYIPEDKSIYLSCESWYLGQGGAVFTDAPIRFFKFSHRFWESLPDKTGAAVVSPPEPDYTAAPGPVIGGDAAALDSASWAQHPFPTENISALTGAAAHAGDPPSELTLSNTSTGGTDYTYALIQEYSGESYDPAVEGAVQSLEWSVDVSVYDNAPIFPALVQGGKVYKRAGNHSTDHQSTGAFTESLPNATQWEEINAAALSSNELSLMGQHPDFSAAGAPITFGIMQWHASTAGTNGTDVLREANYTDFKVTLNQQVTQFTITAFGDSTTAARNVGAGNTGRPVGDSTLNDSYTGWSAVDESSPYLYTWSDQIRDRLAANHPEINWRVLNAGKGGSHSGHDPDHTRFSQNARSRLHSWVRNESPQVVIMQFGINDAHVNSGAFPAGWDDPADPAYLDSRIPLSHPGIPNPGDLDGDFPTAAQIAADPVTFPLGRVSSYEENLCALIDTLRGDGARVILMTPNPRSDANQLQRLAAYAQKMRDVAASKGVPLVDVWQAYDAAIATPGNGIDSYDDLLLDGTHPNATGQLLLADLLEPVLVDVLKDEYQLWSVIEDLPAGQTGIADAPYGDGIPKAMRWTFGLPSGPAAGHANLPRTAGFVNDAGTEYFEIEYVTDPDRTIDVVPQYASHPGGDWIDAYAGAPYAGGHIQILQEASRTLVRIPAAPPRLFVRVELDG